MVSARVNGHNNPAIMGRSGEHRSSLGELAAPAAISGDRRGFINPAGGGVIGDGSSRTVGNASGQPLSAPRAVSQGSPEAMTGCSEYAATLRARLDEPVLLREERHQFRVFDGGGVGGGDVGDNGDADGEEEGAHLPATAHQGQGATWRLRERTKTSNVGLIICLNIGEPSTPYSSRSSVVSVHEINVRLAQDVPHR